MLHFPGQKPRNNEALWPQGLPHSWRRRWRLTKLISQFSMLREETEHAKIGHVKTDRAHFRVHFRDHCEIFHEHSRGRLRGDPVVCLKQKNLNLCGHVHEHRRVHKRLHFLAHEHLRERERETPSPKERPLQGMGVVDRCCRGALLETGSQDPVATRAPTWQ